MTATAVVNPSLLTLFAGRLAGDRHLAVLITTSPSPDPQVAVVNAAVIRHPVPTTRIRRSTPRDNGYCCATSTTLPEAVTPTSTTTTAPCSTNVAVPS